MTSFQLVEAIPNGIAVARPGGPTRSTICCIGSLEALAVYVRAAGDGIAALIERGASESGTKHGVMLIGVVGL